MEAKSAPDFSESLVQTTVWTLLIGFKAPYFAHNANRKINSPYKGTLSSYGYVLLVIYFLVHVKNPPVLPNLQQMPPLRPISPVRGSMGSEKYELIVSAGRNES